MADKTEKVVLSVMPRLGAPKQEYRVEKVVNRIDPMPGQHLSEQKVKDLISMDVRVEIGRTRA